MSVKSSFNCGNCDKCEKELLLSFFPREEDKLKYFEGTVFQIEGVWFLRDCPYFKGGRCMVRDETWLPIQCQIYPCYVNYDGSIGIDYEGCPNAHLVDQPFVDKAQSLLKALKLPKKELREFPPHSP